MRTGWYCPFCNAHHGPHIDTCPRQNSRGVRHVPLKVGGGEMTFDTVIPVVASPEQNRSSYDTVKGWDDEWFSA